MVTFHGADWNKPHLISIRKQIRTPHYTEPNWVSTEEKFYCILGMLLEEICVSILYSVPEEGPSGPKR